MKLIAALCIAFAAALAVGFLGGVSIDFSRSSKSGTSKRLQREVRITQSGLRLSLGQLRSTSIGAGVATFAVVAGITGVPVIALVPAVAAAGIPKGNVERAAKKRMTELRTAWPDGLRDLHASLAAGSSLGQALINLQQTGPAPLRAAFSQFESLSNMLGVQAALEIVRDDIADPITDRIIEVLIVAQERGGNVVVEIVEDLIATSTQELKLADEIDAAGLESRINSRAVLVLPWAVLALLCIGNPDFRTFYGSAGGAVVVLAGAGLSAVGAYILRKLSAPEHEERVVVTGPPVPVGMK